MASDFPELIFKVGANIDGFQQAMSSASDNLLGMLGAVNPKIAEIISGVSAMGGSIQMALGALDAQGFTAEAAQIKDYLHQLGEAAGGAKGETDSLKDSVVEMAGAFGIALTGEALIEGLKEFVTESVEAYGKLQLLTGSLTALTGSGEETENILAGLRDVAKETIVPISELEAAAQKMAGIGVPSDAIVPALSAIADQSLNTGKSFDAIESAVERVFLTGSLSPKSLTAMGLSTQDMAKVMGVAADDVIKDFNALGPESDAALGLLVQAIQNKSEEGAGKMREALPVAINALKTDWEELQKKFGEAITPNVTAMTGQLKDALPSIEALVQEIGKLAASDLGVVVSGLSQIVTVVKEIAAPLSGLFSSDSLGGLVNYFTKLDEARVVIALVSGALTNLSKSEETAVAILGVATGKYPDLTTAMYILDGQMKASTKSTDDHGAALLASKESFYAAGAASEGWRNELAAKVAKEADAKASLDALKAANSELSKDETALAAFRKDTYTPAISEVADAEAAVTLARQNGQAAYDAVVTAETNLKNARDSGKASASDLAALEATAKDAREKLAAATVIYHDKEIDLTASKKDDKLVSDDLLATHAAIDAATRQTTIPALVDHATAINNVAIAKGKVDAAITDLQNAQLAEDFISKDAADYQTKLAAAHAEVEKKKQDLKTAADNYKGAQKDETDSVTLAKGAADALAGADLALANFYRDTLVPGTGDVTAGVIALNQKRADQVTAAGNVVTAEGLLKTAQEGSDPTAIKDATIKLNTERGNLKTATGLVKDAEGELEKATGLSKGQLDLMTASIADPTTGAINRTAQFEAAIKTLNTNSVTELTNLATNADLAYTAIKNSGTTNFTLLNSAAQASAAAHAKLYEVSGDGSLPAAQQLMLAKLKQDGTDFLTSHVTQWSTAYTTIHDDVTGAFTSMDKDLVDGNFGNIGKDWETALKGMASAVLDAFTKPASTAIATFIATSITDLVTGTGSISDAWTELGKNITGVFKSASSGIPSISIPTGGGLPNINNVGSPFPGGTPPLTMPNPTADITGPAGQASSAGSSIAGAASSTLGMVTGIVGAVGAVAGAVFQAFGTADADNMKQTLNYMRNDLWTASQHIVMPGGIFETSADSANMLHGVVGLLGGYILTDMDWAAQGIIDSGKDINAIRNSLLPDLITAVGGGTPVATDATDTIDTTTLGDLGKLLTSEGKQLDLLIANSTDSLKQLGAMRDLLSMAGNAYSDSTEALDRIQGFTGSMAVDTARISSSLADWTKNATPQPIFVYLDGKQIQAYLNQQNGIAMLLQGVPGAI